MLTFITIRTTFEAIHCWPECPNQETYFLKHPHRHVFYVEVIWEIGESREIEFFEAKNKVNELLAIFYHKKDLGSLSCEQIAKNLLLKLNAASVSVFEDNENGATVIGDSSNWRCP